MQTHLENNIKSLFSLFQKGETINIRRIPATKATAGIQKESMGNRKKHPPVHFKKD